jgi:hypothetical protein
MSPLSSTNVVARRDGLVQAEIDGEVAMTSIDDGTCYVLNQVGSRIWNLLEEPTQIGVLCATLLGEFKVDPEVCERQVLDLLEELRSKGLIATLDGSDR